jgi:ribosome-associated toxin RatA of RatAB toxin-antitoxin module
VREVHIAGIVSGVGPDEVFAAVTDIERFPELSDDVRQVQVDNSESRRQSAWKVKFRGGTLEWTECDELDPSTRTMSFRQTHGDFKEFDGEWRVESAGADSAVYFTARFDLGVPALRAVVEPIAAKNLRNNLTAILQALFGPKLRLEED